jgi:accessory colonization factor AcfC
MPTINVRPSSATELQQIADIMARSRKVVVVTGAGISTNCGIPVSPHNLADTLSI